MTVMASQIKFRKCRFTEWTRSILPLMEARQLLAGEWYVYNFKSSECQGVISEDAVIDYKPIKIIH